MLKPHLYDKYLRWCEGADEPAFENAPLEELQECMEYERHLKFKKGRVININSNQ